MFVDNSQNLSRYVLREPAVQAVRWVTRQRDLARQAEKDVRRQLHRMQLAISVLAGELTRSIEAQSVGFFSANVLNEQKQEVIGRLQQILAEGSSEGTSETRS